MRPSVSQLLAWRPAQLTAAGGVLATRAADLQEAAGSLTALGTQMTAVWLGAAANAADVHLQRRVKDIDALATAVNSSAGAVRAAGEAIGSARSALEAAIATAASGGYQVLDDGTVVPPALPPLSLDGLTPAGAAAATSERTEVMRDYATGARGLGNQVAAALDAAGVADAGGTAALDAVVAPTISPPPQVVDEPAPGGPGGRSAASTAAPQVGADPKQVAAWWAGLTQNGQETLLALDPALIGSLDGIPADVRDKANRARLPGLRAAMLAELDAWEAPLRVQARGLAPSERAPAPALDKLAALDVLERTLAKPGRGLLMIDTSAEQTKAVVAIGDVDSARHVAVFTPGFTSTVQGSLSNYDSQMASLQDRASFLPGGSAGSVATVTWLGYEAPQMSGTFTTTSVALKKAAERGAKSLAVFFRGLDAARPVPAHVTALGHSYGSLTTSLALQLGTGVDDGVLFGSPGLATRFVKDLGLQPRRPYLAEARFDPVADLGRFGADPSWQRELFTVLSTREHSVEGQLLQASRGHSEYLNEGTTSQYGIAAVVGGKPELAPVETLEPMPAPLDVLQVGP